MGKAFAPESTSPVLDALVEGIGLAATLKLASWRGGARLYVPNPMPLDHEIVLRLGDEAAGWLADEYPGYKLKVPKATEYLRRRRDERICARHFVEKVSIQTLALEESLDERQVCRILAAGRERYHTAADAPAKPQLTLL